MQYNPQPQPTLPFYLSDNRICQLLERIAVVLEKIAGIPTTSYSVTNEPLPNKESRTG